MAPKIHLVALIQQGVLVRDLCVAISAVIPLLVITLAVQGSEAVSAMILNVTKTAAEGQDDPAAEARSLVAQGSGITKVVLLACSAAEVVTLVMIPFVPEGRPATWWHWIVMVVLVLFVAALFQFVRLLLDSFFRATGEAAARERGHGPSPGQRW